MPTYTVHQPPHENGTGDPERFVFVRDGFRFWAFLLAPVWMLLHRLWLVLIGYAIVVVMFETLLRTAHVRPALHSLAMLVFAVLIGLEAAPLQRFGLRKWKTAGVVVARNREDAERQFFAQWLAREATAPVTAGTGASPPAAGARRGAPQDSHVIGLFPQPEGRR
jgi:uncharacterized protein DUF2628